MMDSKTMKSKIKVLEHAFAASAGAYYNIDLTKDLVPGSMYQVIDDKEYSLNEKMGLPENAKFSDVVAYWGDYLEEEEKSAYFSFFSIPHLLACFRNGEVHVWHKYWTKSALFEPMLAEQHIVMYEEEDTGDVLAVTYVLDLTQKYREEQYKNALEEKQKRLEAALLEATQARQYRELQTALTAVDEILENILVFDAVTNEEEMNQAMPKLLESMGKYSISERAYIFTWASETHQIMRMTHEWCADGVLPTIQDMQNLKMSEIPNWTRKLNRGEAIISMDWESEKEHTPEEYAAFDGQNIHSLIVIPIFASRKLNGYIGFDNPEHSMTALTVRMLSSIGAYLGGLKENLIMVEELKRAVADATLNSEIVDSISKIYWLIYRMDLISGRYEEISAGNEIHRLTGKCGDTAAVFQEICEKIVSKEHQEMMKRFFDMSTLADRLQETESIAVEYRASSGSWHLARFIVKKREESGRVTHVLYAVRQIDRQKQIEIEYRQKLLETAEEAKRANMAKTDFLRRMSHDIRTPINGIQGMIEIAEHYPDNKEKQKECRDKVKKASGFLLDLVNSVLDMNKLESGVVVLENKPFDLSDVMREMNNILEMNSTRKKIKIVIERKEITHSRLIGSPVHLKQIMQNITGNAVKYTEAGGTIRLSSKEISCKDKTAVYQFICSDTGIGMSQEFISHAFEPFAQEDTSARTSYMGTGLGLSITKQLVEMMGGTIRLESEQNKGTTFTVTIPFTIDESSETTLDSGKEQISACSLDGVKVLLAEDNELNMEIAKFILEREGMLVTAAENGQEAVELFEESKENQFDVILMDVMMPVMDGLTAAKKIRHMARPDAARIPIFAMTANAFAEDIEQSKEAGMNEHLSKPLEEQKILDTIRRYVRS